MKKQKTETTLWTVKRAYTTVRSSRIFADKESAQAYADKLNRLFTTRGWRAVQVPKS